MASTSEGCTYAAIFFISLITGYWNCIFRFPLYFICPGAGVHHSFSSAPAQAPLDPPKEKRSGTLVLVYQAISFCNCNWRINDTAYPGTNSSAMLIRLTLLLSPGSATPFCSQTQHRRHYQRHVHLQCPPAAVSRLAYLVVTPRSQRQIAFGNHTACGRLPTRLILVTWLLR